MKTRSAWVGLLCMGLLALIAGGCASSPRPRPNTPVVELSELETSLRPYVGDPQALSNSDGACRSLAQSIVKIPAGTRLPFHFEAKTPFMHTEAAPYAHTLVFDRTVWFYPSGALISLDGCTWRRIDQLGRGKMAFGLGVGGDAQGAVANLGIDLTEGAASAAR